MSEEQRKSPKMDMDRISNLPSDVTQNILERLPIQEAIRTSILSANWRYKSAMLRHLVFDERCVSTQNHRTFASIVDRVLLLHTGPIHSFKLSHPDFLATADIDGWVLHLSRISVKVFVLRIWKGHHYKVPSCLFSCQDITRLDLRNCILKPPSTWKGFKSLKKLKLVDVSMGQDGFENLIVCCPMLTKLCVEDCEGIRHLNIDAPNLEHLVVLGDFKDICLVNTLSLNYFIFGLYHQRRDVGRYGNLIQFTVNLSSIETLVLFGYALKYLAVGGLPRVLPKPLMFLNDVSLYMNFTDLEEISCALCLIKSSPVLQELEIYVHQAEYALGEVNSWIENIEYSCQFTQLKHITIKSIHDVKAELDMIKFLLLSSPVLERMVLQPASVDDSLAILKKVVEFRRASVQAVVIFLDP